MSDYEVLHNEAMNLAEEAIKEKNNNNEKRAFELNCQAFEKEKEVALAADKESEPLRSILLRSAATLGYRCEKYEEAEKLIYLALSGNPPQDLKIELEDLLNKVSFTLHVPSSCDFIKQMKVRAIKQTLSNLFLMDKKDGIIWQIEGEKDASISLAA